MSEPTKPKDQIIEIDEHGKVHDPLGQVPQGVPIREGSPQNTLAPEDAFVAWKQEHYQTHYDQCPFDDNADLCAFMSGIGYAVDHLNVPSRAPCPIKDKGEETERLDWLERRAARGGWTDKERRLSIIFPMETVTFVTLRETIDAAIKADSGKPEASPATTGKGPMELSVLLDQIERRANSATPGPWFDIAHPKWAGSNHRIDANPEAHWGNFNQLAYATPNNAPFIAAARSDVPALVKALREAIAGLGYQNYRKERIAQLLNASSEGRGTDEQGGLPVTQNSSSPASTQGATTPQIWREADDLIICKLPGLEEFRVSNEDAISLLYQLREVVNGKEGDAICHTTSTANADNASSEPLVLSNAAPTSEPESAAPALPLPLSEGSRKAQAGGLSAEAVVFMENAYNHVENALAACNDFIRDVANGVHGDTADDARDKWNTRAPCPIKDKGEETEDLGLKEAATVPVRPIGQKERQHILASARYWFQGSRNAQADGRHAEAVMFMENAYNHVENALAACNDFIRDVANGVLMRDGETLSQRAFKLLASTGGDAPSVPSPTEALTASGVSALPDSPSSPSPLVSVEEWTEDTVGHLIGIRGHKGVTEAINASLASLTEEIERLKQLLEKGWYPDFIAKRDECAALTSRLEEAEKALNEAGVPIGDEHRSYSLAERIECLSRVKTYFVEQTDSLRASLAVAEADRKRLEKALRKWQAWTHITPVNQYPKDCREATDEALTRKAVAEEKISGITDAP